MTIITSAICPMCGIICKTLTAEKDAREKIERDVYEIWCTECEHVYTIADRGLYPLGPEKWGLEE